MYLLMPLTELRTSIVVLHGPTELKDLGDELTPEVLSHLHSSSIKSYSPSEVLAAANAGASWPYYLGLVDYFDDDDMRTFDPTLFN